MGSCEIGSREMGRSCEIREPRNWELRKWELLLATANMLALSATACKKGMRSRKQKSKKLEIDK